MSPFLVHTPLPNAVHVQIELSAHNGRTVSEEGATVAEFVRYTLNDGAHVVFESAESDLVQPHGGQPDVIDRGPLQVRLEAVAAAAEQVAGSLRSRLAPEEIALEFGLKVSGEVNWWFFAKNQAEGTIKVTLKWSPQAQSEEEPEDGNEPRAEPLQGEDQPG